MPLNDSEDIIEVGARIGHFIVQMYNRKCLHSALWNLRNDTCLNFTDFWHK